MPLLAIYENGFRTSTAVTNAFSTLTEHLRVSASLLPCREKENI
jgi:hypothetical protein